ncbi:fibronectin type III domain-containing protein [Micromonospora sp. CPCC 205371]|nr:fibronectin type III domain-containing protein [Micromonospora sp. CPCC 205371]
MTPILALLTLVLVAVGLPASRPITGSGVLVNADVPGAVPGEFLVRLEASVPREQTAAKAAHLTRQHGGEVAHVFTTALHGFSLSATDPQAVRIARDPAVAFVQRNQRAVQYDTQPAPASLWNLDRVDQRAAALDGKLNHGPTSTRVYVLDDGVRATHAEFEGRATLGFSAFSGTGDCGGHGTRVAALVAGKTYGVAKKSPVVSVKVADCATATTDSVTRGIDYVRQNGAAPAVVNMSVGFAATDPVVDQAVRDAIGAGFTFVLAAGNGNRDACTVSPARLGATVPGAIVVSATDRADARHSDANYGACVSLFAPGVDVVSASKDSDTAAAPAATGTSYAAPLVSGLAANVLAAHPSYTPAQVRAAIVADATAGIVTNSASPAAANRLAYLPPPDQPATSVPNTALNTMFNAYGNQGGHWTGGDETVSVPLPDGRVAWLFGDTMLGTVNADGSRPPGQPMVHNSIVVQQGGAITQTLIGGTAAAPKSLVGSETDGNAGDLGWWPGEGRVVGDELQVFYTHVGDGGGGALSFVTLGRAIARFALPSLALRSLTPISLSTNARIGWGAAMVDGQDGYTYVYGMETIEKTNHLYIARVSNSASGGLNAPWEFWTGASNGAGQWSSSDADARPMMTGVGAGFSVKYIDGRFVLVTMDLSLPFTNRVLAFSAGAPTGPFRHPTLLYNAPETSTSDAWVYNARLHPEQTASGVDYVVSYNVNSFDADAVNADVDLYRPKFVNVSLPAPVDASTLPAAPTAVTATSPEFGEVRLTWTAPPGSNLQYWVYERNAGTGATQFTRAQSATAATSASLGVFTPGRYEYRIAAQNGAGEGPQSTVVAVTVTLPPPPSAPAGLAAAQEPGGGVRLSWQPVTAAGWVSYRVYQRDVTAGETAFTESRSVTMDGTSALVGGLTHDHTYAFRVLAFNGGGDGPPSNPVQIVARVAPPPAPGNLVATQNDDGTIGLSWTSSGDGIWYWVYSRDVTAGEAFSRSQYPVASGTTHTSAYLTLGHTYAYYVTAIGQQDVESAPSNTVQAIAAIAPPPAPGNLTATQHDDGTIGLSWTSSGDGIWYYVYSRDVTAGGSFTRSQYPISSGTTHTAGYLVNGHTYAFYVRAIGHGDAESAPSNTVQAVARIGPPPSPTHLTATARSNGDIELSWDPSGPDYWYYVYSRDVTAGGSFTRSQYPISSGTTHTAGFLIVGHTYAFYVTTIGDGGVESAPSNTVQAASYVPPPAAPGNLTASAGNGQVSLSWSSSGAGIWYWVYTRDVTEGGSFTRSQYPVTSGTTHTATMLTNGHTYAFYVTAIGEGSESAPSNTVQARPRVPLPPAPTNLTATSRADGTIDLSWNSSGAGIWYWVYSRNASAGGSFTRSRYPVSNGTTYTAGYLSIGDTYEFYVTAFNDGGETARTNIARAKSTIPPPPAPTGLAALALDDGTIRVHWQSSGAGIWYWVYSREAGAGEFRRSKYPVTSGTSFHSTYLKLGKRYEYYVTAFNAGGESARSNIDSAVSQVAPPLAPQDVRAVPLTSGGVIQVRWVPVPNATGYMVLARSCGSTTWPNYGPMVGATYYLDWKYGGCWEFRVEANRWGVAGPLSGSAMAYMPRNDYPFTGGFNWQPEELGFNRRQCTSFAAWRIRQHHVPNFNWLWRMSYPYFWSHARMWDGLAQMAGVSVSSYPTPGSTYQSDDGEFGHVAFVVGVNGDYVIIEEYNGAVPHGYSIREKKWRGTQLQFLNFQWE